MQQQHHPHPPPPPPPPQDLKATLSQRTRELEQSVVFRDEMQRQAWCAPLKL